MRASLLLAAALGVTLAACGPMALETPSPRFAGLRAPSGTDVYVAPLLVPHASGNAPDTYFVREAQVEFGWLLGAAGVHGDLEAAAPDGTLPRGSFVVRTTLVDTTTFGWSDPETWLCMLTAIPTAGLGCIPVAITGGHSHERETYRFHVRIYDAGGAVTRRVSRDGEVVLAIDTADRRPLLDREIAVPVTEAVGAQSGDPEVRHAYERTVADRVAELLYAQLSPELARAIAHVAATPEPPPAAASAPVASSVVLAEPDPS